ncbi:MAG: HAMP domain-containing histidine kinase, partial [Actinobacteria bacterium]|nr:HAMP domain-containing histidine kinase [Actinomycetota bacterium]
MVKNLLRRRSATARDDRTRLEAERGRIAIEESGEILVVLDESERVLTSSRRAREAVEGLVAGELAPEGLLHPQRGPAPLLVPYELDGHREVLVRLPEPDLSSYEELRSGFTAVVSHELRTPLARLLALLETALLPGTDHSALVEQAREEVEQIRELIDEVLFLSELETGREVVSLGRTRAFPILRGVLESLQDAA